MTFEFDHERMRLLAKALTQRTSREIKLADIYNDIASVFGMKGDAMMHALKAAASKAPGSKAPAVNEDWDFDPTVKLCSIRYFVKNMLHEMDGRNYWNVAMCAVRLESYHDILEAQGEEAASRHLRTFANLLSPKQFSDAIFAYLGGSFFAFGWPCLDTEVDPERRIMDRFQYFDSCLEAEPEKFNFVGAYDLYDNTTVDREVIVNALEKCKLKATNLARARKELAAFPRLRFAD
ncbi:hypothetical protein HFN89_01075 [Rhizobium laguerreae]|nr:hypothetical protein [Rhizobium laguerreae]